MQTSLSQEWYKFRHQPGPLLGLLVLLGLMLIMALSAPVTQSAVVMGFGTPQWLLMIIVIIGANFFIMEDQHTTIRTLLYRHTYRWSIYLAKLLILSLYTGVLVLLSLLFTGLLKIVFAPQLSWQDGQLFSHLLVGMAGTFLVAILLLTIILWLACLFPINTVVIGLILVLTGQGIASLTIDANPMLTAILKWQPLNMLNLMAQLPDSSYQKDTHLSNVQLLVGAIGYSGFFLAIGYWRFKHKRV
ncbi:MAG: ABC transporter permease [Latilactobacillus curvatus]